MANPVPPSPPPPLRPPLRSQRKSKSPSSRPAHSTTKRALDVDQIGPATEAPNGGRTPKGSRAPRGLDAKWEDVTSELRSRRGRTRSTVYQTSDLPSMVKAKRQGGQGQRPDPGPADRGQVRATFV